MSEIDRVAMLTAAIAGAVHAIKWAVQRARYISLETITPLSDAPLVTLPSGAA